MARLSSHPQIVQSFDDGRVILAPYFGVGKVRQGWLFSFFDIHFFMFTRLNGDNGYFLGIGQQNNPALPDFGQQV